MYISNGSETRESGSGNAVLGAYLTDIGFSIKAIAYMTDKGPDSMQWLSFPEAREVGIEVEQQEWNVSAATASRPSQPATYSPAPAVAADPPPQTFAPPAPSYNAPEPD